MRNERYLKAEWNTFLSTRKEFRNHLEKKRSPEKVQKKVLPQVDYFYTLQISILITKLSRGD